MTSEPKFYLPSFGFSGSNFIYNDKVNKVKSRGLLTWVLRFEKNKVSLNNIFGFGLEKTSSQKRSNP